MADINSVSDAENSSEYKEHAKKYTNFLEEYKTYTRNSNNLKNKYKKIFFWIIIAILCTLVLLFFASVFIGFASFIFIVVLEKESVETIAGIITTVISSFSAVLVALFKLPKIIAEYFFNKEEDNSMVKVIEQIQQYDREMYALEINIEQKAMEQQNISNTDVDDVVVSNEEPNVPGSNSIKFVNLGNIESSEDIQNIENTDSNENTNQGTG